MNRALLLAVLLCGTPVSVVAQTSPFEGFYLGALIGSASSSTDVAATTVDTPTGYSIPDGTYFQASSVPAVNAAGQQRFEETAFTGGAFAGYDWRAGRLLIGSEVDVASIALSGDATANVTYPCCAPNSFTIRQQFAVDWMSTVRGRVGYASSRWLLYGTGGLAFAPFELNASFSDAFLAAAQVRRSETRTGWAAGGGLEYLLGSGRWSLAAKYLHVQFGELRHVDRSLTQFGTLAFPNSPFTHTADLSAHVVNAGVTVRF